MQLIRLGDLRGVNLDMLVSWEIEAPPAPEPGPDMPAGVAETPPEGSEPPPPEADPTNLPVATTETVNVPAAAPVAAEPAEAPEAPPTRMTLTLASGGAFQTMTLEGQEADTMRAYLQGKSGALIR